MDHKFQYLNVLYKKLHFSNCIFFNVGFLTTYDFGAIMYIYWLID